MRGKPARGRTRVGGGGWRRSAGSRRSNCANVTLTDEAGRTVVSVPRITSEKSLLALARNHAEPGAFALENPTIALVCEKNTTNLETALAQYLKDDGTPPAPTRTPVSVRVTGGKLTLTETETGKTASIDDISAQVDVPANRAEPVTVKFTTATGKLDAQVSVGDSGSVKIVCSDLPLDAFAPLELKALLIRD